MIPQLFYDILDINISRIPHILSPHLYLFLWTLSKVLVGSSNLVDMGLYVPPLPASWTAGIRYDPLWLGDCVCASVCVYAMCVRTVLLPKPASLLTFSGRGMTEWSSRSSPHLPQLLSVVTFCQTPGNPDRPDLPQPMFIQETGGPVEPRDSLSLGTTERGSFVQGTWVILLINIKSRDGEKIVCITKQGELYIH